MNDARLIHQAADAYRNAEALRARDVARIRGVVNDDSTINPDAVASITPLQTTAWWIPGAAAVGTNVNAEHRIPQAATAIRIDANAKTPPSTSEYTADILANGTSLGAVSVAIGASDGVSIITSPIPAGAKLTVNVIQHGSAADITITLSYRPTVS